MIIASDSIVKRAYAEVRKPLLLVLVLLFASVLSAVYPSKLDTYPVLPNGVAPPVGVTVTERYARFVPTAVQIALPIVLGDRVGLVQLAYVGISTTVATHGIKHLLRNRSIMGSRLDLRPNHGPMNMPSGHSSMASCAAWFVGRRYSIWLGVLLSVFVVITMYARVVLNAHTISAVLAGALIGCIAAAWFTSPRAPPG